MAKTKSQFLNSPLTPFEELRKNIMATLRVGTMGRVVSFNPDRGTVDVQPFIKEQIETEDGIIEVDIPLILNAPVFFMGGQTFTPAENDICLLIHLDRSFQLMVETYDTGNPETIKTYGQANSRRKHDLNDVVAFVGFLSYKQASEVEF